MTFRRLNSAQSWIWWVNAPLVAWRGVHQGSFFEVLVWFGLLFAYFPKTWFSGSAHSEEGVEEVISCENVELVANDNERNNMCKTPTFYE